MSAGEPTAVLAVFCVGTAAWFVRGLRVLRSRPAPGRFVRELLAEGFRRRLGLMAVSLVAVIVFSRSRVLWSVILYAIAGLYLVSETPPREILFKLEGLLLRLLSPPEEQIAWLRRTQRGVLTTEPLIDAFKSMAFRIPDLRIGGILTQEQAERIYALDVKIAQMCARRTPERWSEQDLRESPDWVEVRRLAAAAREALQEEATIKVSP